MKRRHTKSIVILAAALVLLANAPVGPAQAAQKNSGKTIVIEILDGFVSPSIVAIEPETTVVWENITENFVNVNFVMGAQVEKPCSVPTDFELSGGAYQTASLPPGGTAKLCLVTPGTYNFIVIPPGALVLGSQPALGTIIVEYN